MTRISQFFTQAVARARALAWLMMAAYLSIAFSPLAMAAKKKVEAVKEEKSYVMPIIIMLALVGVGLMTVCRPSTRLDKAPEPARKDEEE